MTITKPAGTMVELINNNNKSLSSVRDDDPDFIKFVEEMEDVSDNNHNHNP